MRWTKSWKKNARPAKLKRATLFLLFLLTTGIVPAGISQDITIRSQSNIVFVPVLVKDPTGQIVYGLNANDFVIEDDGVAQTVHIDDAPDAQPLWLVIAIQKGRRANYEFSRIRTLATMIEPLFSNEKAANGQTKAALVEFDSGVKTVRDFTGNFSLIEDDLEKLKPGDNGAAILDA